MKPKNDLPRDDTVKIYEDWLIIAVKTDTRLATYSFIAINPQDELFHIDEDKFATVENALEVGGRFVDLEEARQLAKG